MDLGGPRRPPQGVQAGDAQAREGPEIGNAAGGAVAGAGTRRAAFRVVRRVDGGRRAALRAAWRVSGGPQGNTKSLSLSKTVLYYSTLPAPCAGLQSSAWISACLERPSDNGKFERAFQAGGYPCAALRKERAAYPGGAGRTCTTTPR
eukprot:1179402-Prorocentrum_minimum.AAC.1